MMKHNFVTGDLVTVSFGWDREIYVYLAGVMYEVAKVAILMGSNGNIKKFYERAVQPLRRSPL